MNLSLTQSLGMHVKQSLETAYHQRDFVSTHLVGRISLLGIAIVGTAEIIARLSFFFLGHVAGIFTLYRSPEINQYLTEQIQFGFSAALITSASLFSFLSPDFFRTVQIPQDPVFAPPPPFYQQFQEEAPAAVPVQRAAPLLDDQEIREDQRIASLIEEIVLLPFQMLALAFKLPFYCIYLGFHFSLILPMRLIMLPLEIFLSVITFQKPRNPFRLHLI